jgi:hypothetical protein
MMALVLADAFLEKFAGDSLGEVRRNYEGYIQQLSERRHHLAAAAAGPEAEASH